MPIDTSLLRPVAQPQPFNFAALQQSMLQGQQRDTNLSAGDLAAQGNYSGAAARAFQGGNAPLAATMFDAGNQQHVAGLKSQIEKVSTIQTPADWNRWRASVLAAGGNDPGGFDKKDVVLGHMTDALDPEAAASRRQSSSQFGQTLALQREQMNKPVVVPYGSTLTSPGTGQPVGGARPGAATDQGDVLAGVDPQIAQMVKGVANYSLDLNSLPRSGPVRQQVLSLVQQYDPTFSAANYPARAATIKSFASGPDAQNVASLNTAIGHLGTLYDTVPALKNASIPGVGNILNSAKNAWNAGGPGGVPLAQFNYAANAVSNELGKVFKGSGAVAEGEMRDWQKQLNAASSPEQLNAVIQQGVELLHSRMDAIQTKYSSAMGRPLDTPLINEKSQSVLDRIMGKASLAPPAPNQSVGSQAGASINAPAPAQAAPLTAGKYTWTPQGLVPQ